LTTPDGRIRLVGEVPVAKPGVATKGVLFIDMERNKLKDRKTSLKIEVVSNGKVMDHVKTNFLGPFK
ncbi:MAG: cytochrome c oxidase accessory protein CcoG, partial [Saprospiraceae bacterium]